MNAFLAKPHGRSGGARYHVWVVPERSVCLSEKTRNPPPASPRWRPYRGRLPATTCLNCIQWLKGNTVTLYTGGV